MKLFILIAFLCGEPEYIVMVKSNEIFHGYYDKSVTSPKANASMSRMLNGIPPEMIRYDSVELNSECVSI